MQGHALSRGEGRVRCWHSEAVGDWQQAELGANVTTMATCQRSRRDPSAVK